MDKKLHNYTTLKEGFVAAPVLVESRWRFIEMGCDPDSMRTWTMPNGKKVLVTFTSVEEERYESYMKFFNSEVNEYFDGYGEVSYNEQYARCPINGVPCSKHNHCCTCKRLVDESKPHSADENPYLKDIRAYSNFVSYEGLVEEGYEGGVTYGEAEDDLCKEDLMEAAKITNPIYPTIIELKIQGYKPGAILDKLALKKTSTNYDLVARALAFAKDYLTK